jgi:putative heme-binding domain-containing protein
LAQQELLHRTDKSIAETLRTVATSSPSPQARVHALWTLLGLQELQDADVLAALRDTHPGVVRSAILLAELRIADSDALLQAVAALVDHSDPKVKLQLALTLGESKSPPAGEALAQLVPDAMQDRWLAEAIASSSMHHSLPVLERLLLCLQEQTQGASRTAVNTQQVTMLADLIASADAAGANPSALVAQALANARRDASWVFSLAAACTEMNDWKHRLDPECRDEIQTVYDRAKSLATSPAAPASVRCQALHLFGRSLGPADQESSLLAELLAPTTTLELQLAAVERLIAFRSRESTRQLLSHWDHLSYSVRDTAALQLTSNAASMEALIAALESGDIAVGDLSPAVRQTLRQSGSQSLQARVNRLLGKTTAANQQLIGEYLRFQESTSQKPDLSRGRALFEKHCAACHVPDAAGRATGPNLSNLSDRSRAALTEAILAPNRSVEPQYHGYIVQLADGRVLSGIIADEAGDALTLYLADGRRTTTQRSEIEDLRSTGVSLMPEGMQHELNPAMLMDLIEFVRSDEFAQTIE